MSVEEIETGIAELPAAELAHLLTWLGNFRATDPDALSTHEAAEIRKGITRGLTDCDAGSAQTAREWAVSLRLEFNMQAISHDSAVL